MAEKQILSQYLKDSEKTLSGKFFYDEKNENEPDVYHFSKLAIKATEDLDLVKKKKYYGKPVNISSSAPGDIKFNRDEKGENLLHAAIGIVTESGELLDTILKYKYGEKELDVVNIKEELGDVMWYIAILLRDLDIDLYDAMDVNISKLKSRYGDKFSSEKAINRDLDTERKILEGGVVVESRELSSGGMKPPKNNWTSYASSIEISESEKNRLKQEMAIKLGLVAEEKIKKRDGSLGLEDVSEAFSFLEENDGSFVIKIITDRKEVEELNRTLQINLVEFKNKIAKADMIALSFYDVLANNNLGHSRFVMLLNFDQMTGVLKLDRILGPSNEIITLNSVQQSEIDAYLIKNNIEK